MVEPFIQGWWRFSDDHGKHAAQASQHSLVLPQKKQVPEVKEQEIKQGWNFLLGQEVQGLFDILFFDILLLFSGSHALQGHRANL
jgi:hypothetical protein